MNIDYDDLVGSKVSVSLKGYGKGKRLYGILVDVGEDHIVLKPNNNSNFTVKKMYIEKASISAIWVS